MTIHWGVTKEELDAGLEELTTMQIPLSESKDDETLLHFLACKKIYLDSPDRNTLFSRLVNPDLAGSEKESYMQAKKRLRLLIGKEGDLVSATLPKDVQSFEAFVALNPTWEDPSNSFVCHRDDPDLKGTLVQRKQLSGLCYIHGPDVVQHYLVSKVLKEPAGMIDISKLIRHTFDSKDLGKYIFQDVGGSSQKMLEHILTPDSIVAAEATRYVDKARLLEVGPLLVSGFKVYNDFFEGDASSLSGKPKGDFRGLHAMVLIGVRVDDVSGVKKFLLQNWWPKKQFVEMDEIYLKCCGATLYYVETPQTHIPAAFPRTLSMFAEMEILDKDESLPNEWGW